MLAHEATRELGQSRPPPSSFAFLCSLLSIELVVNCYYGFTSIDEVAKVQQCAAIATTVCCLLWKSLNYRLKHVHY